MTNKSKLLCMPSACCFFLLVGLKCEAFAPLGSFSHTPVSAHKVLVPLHVTRRETGASIGPRFPTNAVHRQQETQSRFGVAVENVKKIKSRLHASSSTSGDVDISNGRGKQIAASVASTLSLVFFDVLLRRYFQKANISFPSSLAGCGILFATMLTVYAIDPASGDSLYGALNPGATILAKWLPVFFVPSLVTLPLAEPLESALEVAKVASVVIGGFFFTLLTTSFSVLAVRRLQDASFTRHAEAVPSDDSENSVTDSISATATAAPAPTPKKAFSDSTFKALSTCALASGFVAACPGAGLTNPATSLFLLFTTLSSFVFGARLPPKFTKIVHPLVTCTAFTWIGAKVIGVFSSKAFIDVLRSYKTGSLSALSAGAGDLLLFMLGPAVVALACQMYSRKDLMRQNVAEVFTSLVVSSFGGLFSTAAMVRLANIGNSSLRLSLLSRNITSPLAMAIASILGADVSMAVSMVVISGLIGANFGAATFDFAGIKDPVARGLGIGAAAHGLGTAAFANEKDAFPFAAIAMALTASCSTVLVTVPVIRKALLKVALGA